jgi:hypothetical protein
VRPSTTLFIIEYFLPPIMIVWSLLSQCLSLSTEHSHVKTNMAHALHRVKVVGSQPLDSFKDLLTEEEFRKCTNSPHLGKTWFKLTTNVFVSFLFWVIFILHHSFHYLLGLIFPILEGSPLAISCTSILMLVLLSSLTARDCRGLR